MSEAIKTFCAWCGALIKDGPTVNGLVSHGICEACLKKMESEGKL